MKKILFSLISLVYVFGSNLKAQHTTTDKTLSPYFFVKSKDKNTDQMPLKHTSAEVNIAGVIADVKVTQVYQNEGKNTLEAIYIFPGSTRAAVYAMTMTIGERKLVAKIEERQKARQDYEKAKEEGKTASLLEQQNPNVFQMNVANILPGDKITVELHYTELLEPTEGVYSFAYPTVVGPRYSETPIDAAQDNEKWVSNPYLKEGKDPNYTFHISTTLNTGVPIQEVVCASHQVRTNFLGTNTCKIELEKSDKSRGNKDFVLKYRLSGGQIQSGLLLYEGENAVAMGTEKIYEDTSDEKFFLLMMQPPKAPTLDQIPPREYVFIVDVSGSMHGFPLDIAKKLLRELIGSLRPSDRFNVMLFESSNQMLADESMPATQEYIEKALKVIDNQRGSGGTRLLPALKNALNFKQTRNFSRTFVVLTDGYVTVEREAFDLIRDNLNQANLFAFGIGTSVNRYLIEGMAHVGIGEPFFVLNPNEATSVSEKFKKYVESPVLTNIQIAYEGFEVYDVEPKSVPDVFAERPIIIYGKYKGTPKGKITLKGLSGNKEYSYSIPVSQTHTQNNQAIRYLWARKRIQLLDDYNRLSVSYYNGYSEDYVKGMIANNPTNAERIKEVTQLGLKYNLLTAYTSFIAIDSEVRNKEGKITTVHQPLPLPEGVSDRAVGNPSSTQYYSGIVPQNRKHNAKIKKDVKTIEKPLSISTNSNNVGDSEEDTSISETRKAGFEGGDEAWKSFVKQNMVFPTSAKQKGIKGIVRIAFTIQADGTLSHFNILEGLGEGCDEEAVRLIKLATKWKPEIKNGVTVSSTIQVEVNFE